MSGGKHRAITEPMQAVRPTSPPIDPAPATESMPRITSADVKAYDTARKAITDTNEWMAPLRPGPADRRTELTLRLTLRSRGLALWRTLRKAVGR